MGKYLVRQGNLSQPIMVERDLIPFERSRLRTSANADYRSKEWISSRIEGRLTTRKDVCPLQERKGTVWLLQAIKPYSMVCLDHLASRFGIEMV
jgi:hypothetical protein